MLLIHAQLLPCSSPNESHQTVLLRSNVLRFSCLMSFIELSELRRNTPRITDQSSHISKESHLLLLQGFSCKGIIKNSENKTRSSPHPTVMLNEQELTEITRTRTHGQRLLSCIIFSHQEITSLQAAELYIMHVGVIPGTMESAHSCCN